MSFATHSNLMHSDDPGPLSSGASAFPTAVTEDLFYRDDLHLLFYYDGTRWLTVNGYERQLSRRGDASEPTGTTSDIHYWTSVQDAIYITDFIVSYFVNSGGTALGASHKWVLTLHVVDSAGSTGSAIATINIDSGSSNVFRGATASVTTATVAGDLTLHVKATKTGTPGNLAIKPVIRYRRIAA